MPATRLLFVGGWGHHSLRELVADGSIDVAAVACGDGFDDMARLIADSVEAIEWHDDPERALAEVAPDIVSVGAVYGQIGDWVERALAAGASVVADKPIATSDDQLSRISRLLADRPQQRLVTELPARADAAFRTARRIVAEGGVGDPVLVTAQKSYVFGDRPPWYDEPRHYPGTELWVATHAFDFARFVTGRRLTPIAGRSANGSLPDWSTLDDHTVSVCALEGGGTAVVHADYLRPSDATTHGDDRLRVAGSTGVVEVRGGCCWLLDGTERDVTDTVLGTDPAAHVWELVNHDDDETPRSLELAAVSLAARSLSR
ncbi:MAG: Gfo/Idh/MocA family protein [Acidimicrobiales bacterium]